MSNAPFSLPEEFAVYHGRSRAYQIVLAEQHGSLRDDIIRNGVRVNGLFPQYRISNAFVAPETALSWLFFQYPDTREGDCIIYKNPARRLHLHCRSRTGYLKHGNRLVPILKFDSLSCAFQAHYTMVRAQRSEQLITLTPPVIIIHPQPHHTTYPYQNNMLGYTYFAQNIRIPNSNVNEVASQLGYSIQHTLEMASILVNGAQFKPSSEGFSTVLSIPRHCIELLIIDAITQEQNCPISMEQLTRDNIAVTSCGHRFRKGTLEQWIDAGKTSCPVCKATFTILHGKIESSISEIIANSC